MAQVTQDLLPLALGVALSPIPIIAVIIMLLSARARATSWGFLLGWLLGISVTCLVFVVVGHVLHVEHGSALSKVAAILVRSSWLCLAACSPRGRGDGDRVRGKRRTLPVWLATADRLSVGRAAALGVLLSAANPKNLVLCQSAGTTIAGADLDFGAGSSGQFGCSPLLAASTRWLFRYWRMRWLGSGQQDPLDRFRGWLIAQANVVTTVLLLVIAVVLIVRGAKGLA